MTCGNFFVSGWFWACGLIEIRVVLCVFLLLFKQVYCTAMTSNAVKKFCVCNSDQKGSVNEFVFLISWPGFENWCFFFSLLLKLKAFWNFERYTSTQNGPFEKKIKLSQSWKYLCDSVNVQWSARYTVYSLYWFLFFPFFSWFGKTVFQ